MMDKRIQEAVDLLREVIDDIDSGKDSAVEGFDKHACVYLFTDIVDEMKRILDDHYEEAGAFARREGDEADEEEDS